MAVKYTPCELHRFNGGDLRYVSVKLKRSQSNLRSLAYKQACRLVSLDYHLCNLRSADFNLHTIKYNWTYHKEKPKKWCVHFLFKNLLLLCWLKNLPFKLSQRLTTSIANCIDKSKTKLSDIKFSQEWNDGEPSWNVALLRTQHEIKCYALNEMMPWAS